MPKEVLHKQCLGRIRRCHCIGGHVEDDWVETTHNNSVMSDDGESNQ
jgi:hypothetical protein